MNNKVGIYYAYWTHEWDVDFNPFIDKVANLGFDILEVNGGTIAKMSRNERLTLVNHARDCGLELTYCIGLPANYDIASANESVRQNGIKFLQAQAEGIGEMGGGKLSGILYSSWPATMPEGETDKRPYLDRSITSMKQAIKSAEDNNVFFNMEVVNRFEQYLLNTAAEAVNYVKAVNSPNIGILLDTFHMNIEEDSIASAVETAGKYIGHIHLGENHRMPPGCGHGHIPWDELIMSLKKIGYQGFLVMEPFMVPGGQVGRDIKIWHDSSIGFNLDDEARKSARFMKEHLLAAG